LTSVSTIQRPAQSCRYTDQLTTGTAHLTRKMTCSGSGAGTVRLMKRTYHRSILQPEPNASPHDGPVGQLAEATTLDLLGGGA
jgi:hypothetical protein